MKILTKTQDAQVAQFDPTVEERFQTQTKNTSAIENYTFNDIRLNQTQNEGHRDEEIQQHRDVENIPINAFKSQLIEFRQK